jgi:hypothetical protein
LHYVAGQHVTADRPSGYAIFPSALHDGQCSYFREAREVRLKWGFKKLYPLVRHYLRAELRRALIGLLGSNGSYYRYQTGRRRLTPEQQEQVQRLLARFGYDGPPPFEHESVAYDYLTP